jgi:hypothetical protein
MPETSAERQTLESSNEALVKRLSSAIGAVIEGSLKTDHPNVERFTRDSQGKPTRVETDDFKKLRDEFLKPFKKPISNKWKGLSMRYGTLPSGAFIGKDKLGFNLMAMINKDGAKEGDPLKLAKILAVILEGGPVSLASLRELEDYFELLEAKVGEMTLDAIKPYPEEDPAIPKEILACDLVDGFEALMGNSLVDAIMDQDFKNQKRKFSRRTQ